MPARARKEVIFLSFFSDPSVSRRQHPSAPLESATIFERSKNHLNKFLGAPSKVLCDELSPEIKKEMAMGRRNKTKGGQEMLKKLNFVVAASVLSLSGVAGAGAPAATASQGSLASKLTPVKIIKDKISLTLGKAPSFKAAIDALKGNAPKATETAKLKDDDKKEAECNHLSDLIARELLGERSLPEWDGWLAQMSARDPASRYRRARQARAELPSTGTATRRLPTEGGPMSEVQT